MCAPRSSHTFLSEAVRTRIESSATLVSFLEARSPPTSVPYVAMRGSRSLPVMSLGLCAALVRSWAPRRTLSRSLSSLRATVDDEEVQVNGARSFNSLDGFRQGAGKDRFDSLLNDVGLDPTEFKTVQDLARSRVVSPNDVFCNRELKMNGIKAVGFDMDYTLAQYQQPAFDKLAFDGAKEKLVKNFGYPIEVLDFEYDHEFWTRGLIIDTQRGNFLKIDRHKYVRVVYHGFEKMSSTTRKYLYSRTFNKVLSFSEKHFVNMGKSAPRALRVYAVDHSHVLQILSSSLSTLISSRR